METKTLADIVREYPLLIKETYNGCNIEFHGNDYYYIESGRVFQASSPYNLENKELVVVYMKYRYLMFSNWDKAFIPIFYLKDGTTAKEIRIGDWKLSIGGNWFSQYRSNMSYTIHNEVMGGCEYGDANYFPYVWERFSLAMKCSTKEEWENIMV